MSYIQTLDDEQAALIWSGETASLAGLDKSTTEGDNNPDTPAAAEDTKNDDNKTLFSDTDLDKIFNEEDDDDEEQDDTVDTNLNVSPDASVPDSAKPKPGRKPADIINIVNQLITDDILEPFEEGDEIKTIDDVKDLIKLNLQKTKETAKSNWWEEEVKTYSPQIQAILHYAKQGGKDVTPLLDAISQVEEVADLDPDTEEGQIEIIRQTLKVKGIDDEEIEDQINTAKDLDKLKIKADKFLPELQSMKERHVQMLMRQEEQRKIQAAEASTQYLNTVKETLNKDSIGGMKLQREDKAKIFEALAVPKYKSLNGIQTNGFVKSLEDMQFGSKADYEHFLNIVHFSVDKESFLEKLKQSIKNELSVDTERKLRSAKTTTANTQGDIPDNTPTKPSKTVSRSGFKNPFN